MPYTSSVDTWRNRKPRARVGRQRRHVPARRFEQHERADDVRVDERLRAVDRPIDVRLGSEIQDGVRPRVGEHARHDVAIGDVALDERHARILQRPLEIQQAAGVRQLVDDDDAMGRVIERVLNEVRADEAGAAGDEKRHRLRS